MPIRFRTTSKPDEIKQRAVISDEQGEELCEVEVTSADCVRDLKAKIAEKLEVDVRGQELRYEEALLGEEVSLAPLIVGSSMRFVLFRGEPAKIDALTHVRAGGSLTDLSPRFRDDPDVVFLAASNSIVQLQKASQNLQSDPEFMARCVALNPSAIYYTAVNMWDNPTFVRSSVARDGNLLQNASEELRNDPAIVKTAVEMNGHALQYAGPEMRDDDVIVYAAVSQAGTALKWASPRLKNDRDVVLMAVRNNKVAYCHASKELKDDPDVQEAKEQQRGDMISRPATDPAILVKQRFKKLDKNGDGYLDYQELEDLLRAGNPDIADWEVQVLFEAVDKSKDGKVEFEEFCDFVFSQDDDSDD